MEAGYTLSVADSEVGKSVVLAVAVGTADMLDTANVS